MAGGRAGAGRLTGRGVALYATSEMDTNEPATPAAPDGAAPAPAAPEPPPLDGRRRRILFRATHRGTHETDLLIGGYVGPRLAAMTEAELDAVEEVMELPDVALADWLCGRTPIPADVASPLLLAMREAALAGSARGAGKVVEGGTLEGEADPA